MIMSLAQHRNASVKVIRITQGQAASGGVKQTPSTAYESIPCRLWRPPIVTGATERMAQGRDAEVVDYRFNFDPQYDIRNTDEIEIVGETDRYRLLTANKVKGKGRTVHHTECEAVLIQ